MSQAFFATCDLSAIVRGRGVPEARLASALEVGVGWVPADLGLTFLGGIAPDNVFGSTGDLRLLPDVATATNLSGLRLYLADQINPDGSPWSACPRSALKQALRALQEATGLSVLAAFEHEFMLDPLPATAPFSLARHRVAEPFGSELLAAMAASGLEPESWLPEYGDAQYEITMQPTNGLRAADNAIILRELVRDLARSHAMRASFAPLPSPTATGNGVHVHLSLQDGDGRSVMHDASMPGHLSETAARFSAGILRHANALVALTAPSPSSYFRLTPHRWSAGGAFLGERNREALLRICPTIAMVEHEEAAQLHLEFRGADATSNPWLVLAALVRAGLHGLLEPLDAAVVWPESATEADLGAVPALPRSLDEALAALELDEEASTWFGEHLLETFISVKREELAAVAGLDDQQTCSIVWDAY